MDYTEKGVSALFTIGAIVIGFLIIKFLEKKMCKDCKTAQVGLTASGTSIPRTAAPTPTAVGTTVTTTSDVANARMYRG